MDEVLHPTAGSPISIHNSITDASPHGSHIRVQLERLAKADASREWVRVRSSTMVK